MQRCEQKKMEAIIKAEEITVGYNNESILYADDFNINSGNLVFIHGASGVGKTSFLKTLLLLLKPLSGELYWHEKQVWYNDVPFRQVSYIREKRANNFSFIFQSLRLFENWSVKENIEFPLKIRNKNPDGNVSDSMKLLMRKMELYEYLNRKEKVKDLSGGEKQRVAVCRAFVTSPNLILADEPWNSLDYSLKDVVIGEFYNFILKGNSVVVVCHDMVIPWISGKTKLYIVEKKTDAKKKSTIKRSKICACSSLIKATNVPDNSLLEVKIMRMECEGCKGIVTLKKKW